MSSKTETNYDKVYDDNIRTRLIMLGPNAKVSEPEIVRKLNLLDNDLLIKSTCFGALISGKKEEVDAAIKEIRKLDPYNIFTKERGFPPGDPRRCRGHRSAPREGFHQLEKEFGLLGYVSEALQYSYEGKLEKKTKIPVNEFEDIVNEKGKKHDNKS